MNDLIRYVASCGMSDEVYAGFHVLGFLAVFLFVVWYGRKIGLPGWKSVVTVLIVYPVIYGWMYVMYWIESGFQNFGGNNIVRVFVYVPLVGLPVAKLLKVEWKKMLSLLAFAPLVVHGVSHFGCVFVGCCEGYPETWGLYNVIRDEYVFPNQPMEAIVAILIIVYLLYRAKRKRYIPDGIEFPIMLAWFGSTRFLFEFLRNNEKILLGCSDLSFHALFMCVVGVVWIIAAKWKKAVAKTAVT